MILNQRRNTGATTPGSPMNKLFEKPAAAEAPMAARAARMLIAPTALAQLSLDEARAVLPYMRPHRIAEGEVFISEGEKRKNDFMLLILDGEITVETVVVSRTSPMVMSVLGPGSLVGELGLLDGEPRMASCRAITPVSAALFSRTALARLLDDDPATGAKLVLAVAARMAQRLRDEADKLKLYVQLTQAMQGEINALMRE